MKVSGVFVVTGPDVGTVPTTHWGLTSQAGAYTTGFVTGPAVPPAGTGSPHTPHQPGSADMRSS